jgi:leukotriene-A4 hydrolase
MYTQCQAILARTLLPCQDTPCVKVVVHSKLTSPNPLRALFGGIETGSSPIDDKHTCYEYVQNIPIPTYLIAIACGYVEYGKLSERCGVWTEVGMIDKAVYEFADTEKFLSTAENYLSPYQWGVYNILVLPFSFPYGGMENPCLTFVSPALIAGDRSMTNVIAHEIAHSWTGNLVTNMDWINFWMNEGFTKFMERKISELINGEDMSNLEANVGKGELNYAIESIGPDHSYTSLLPDLTNVDPDDAFSVVPYEKGYTLLYFIETLIGKEKWQEIFRGYINTYALKSVSWKEFREYFENGVKKLFNNADDILSQIDWDTWMFKPGHPIKTFDYPSKWLNEGESLAKKLINGEKLSDNDVTNFNNWHTNVKLVLLNTLNEDITKLTQETYIEMRDRFNLHIKQNAEVAYVWFQICLKLKQSDAIPFIQDFLLNNGRMKYIKPVYFAYYSYNKEECLTFFDKNKFIYHPVASRIIEKQFSAWNS